MDIQNTKHTEINLEYVKQLEDQNEILKEALAKQQEDNIELIRQNQFAAHWHPIHDPSNPNKEPETYHYKLNNVTLVIVYMMHNNGKMWDVKFEISQVQHGFYSKYYKSFEEARSYVEGRFKS